MDKLLKISTAFSVVLLCVFLMISCEKHVQEDEFTEVKEVSCDVSYKTTIQPMIEAKCLPCHAGSQAPNLSTFSGLSRNAARVKEEVVARRMPLGGSLTSEQIQQISCWIDNGALDN